MLIELDKDMNNVMFSRRANGLAAARIKSPLRVRQDLFFARKPGMPVDICDRYQSFNDFKNDVKKLVFVPFACEYLSTRHLSNAVLDLSSLLLDMFFLDWDEQNNYYREAIISVFYEAGLATAYQALQIIYLVDVLLEISARLIITAVSDIIDGLRYLSNEFNEKVVKQQAFA